MLVLMKLHLIKRRTWSGFKKTKNIVDRRLASGKKCRLPKNSFFFEFHLLLMNKSVNNLVQKEKMMMKKKRKHIKWENYRCTSSYKCRKSALNILVADNVHKREKQSHWIRKLIIHTNEESFAKIFQNSSEIGQIKVSPIQSIHSGSLNS